MDFFPLSSQLMMMLPAAASEIFAGGNSIDGWRKEEEGRGGGERD